MVSVSVSTPYLSYTEHRIGNILHVHQGGSLRQCTKSALVYDRTIVCLHPYSSSIEGTLCKKYSNCTWGPSFTALQKVDVIHMPWMAVAHCKDNIHGAGATYGYNLYMYMYMYILYVLGEYLAFLASRSKPTA